jgi:hypothetical protein
MSPPAGTLGSWIHRYSMLQMEATEEAKMIMIPTEGFAFQEKENYIALKMGTGHKCSNG